MYTKVFETTKRHRRLWLVRCVWEETARQKLHDLRVRTCTLDTPAVNHHTVVHPIAVNDGQLDRSHIVSDVCWTALTTMSEKYLLAYPAQVYFFKARTCPYFPPMEWFIRMHS